jgi:transitional endoplasmic reticulum ATPase
MPLKDDVDMNKLAKMSHGYTGADLSSLGRETAMKALRRYLPEINLEEERIPPSVLEKMEVRMEDFLNAYREITPTAMREVYIEVPTVRWTDIGGLAEVKQDLIEAVEWPLKTPEAFTRIGIRPPKGIMLYGPPGCGKHTKI